LIFSQQRIGTLPKEDRVGKTVTQYKTTLAKAGHDFESVDVATALGAVMAIKDDDELVGVLKR
jgi:nucleosome binding factor SPN SPT16 subunit